MGIATLVAWLWMAGQSGNAHQCYTRPAGDGCNTETVCYDNLSKQWVGVTTTLAYCTPKVQFQLAEPVNPPAPAEHVVEIRTKREEQSFDDHGDFGESKHSQKDCRAGFTYIPYGPDGKCLDCFAYERCVHVTHEIWIDNVKWGVLRETESK